MNNIPDVENEIGLLYILRVIIKRKRLIVSGTFLSLVIGVAVFFILPKVYKASFVVDIGVIQRGDKWEPLETLEHVSAKVEHGYSYMARKVLDIAEEEFPKIKTRSAKSTKLVEAYIETHDIAKGLKILEYIEKELLNDHKKITNWSRVAIENSINELKVKEGELNDTKKFLEKQLIILKSSTKATESQLKTIRNRMDALLDEKKKVNLAANPDNTLSLLVFTNEIQANQRYYNDLENKLNFTLTNEEARLGKEIFANEHKRQKLEMEKPQLEAQLASLQETKLIKEASYSKRPLFPKKGLLIPLAGIAGLMGSLFLAFFMEFFEMYRQDLKPDPIPSVKEK